MPSAKPSSRASPRTKAAAPAAAPVAAVVSSPASKDAKGKKRVRVVEPEEEVAEVAVTPATAKKAGKKVEAVEEEKKEVKATKSADSPAAPKSALKKAAGKKAKAVEVEEVAAVEEDVIELEDEAEEEIDFLQGFESEDGEDSSDEEMESAEAVAFKIESLPTVSASESSVQKKLEEKAERKRNAKTGTIYLGRIPIGFHEAEMKSYFSQFGEITRLRLSRNKSSGASKHYAFLEFAYASVAQIVQETMDNYLLSGHILVCKIVPDDEIHPKLWLGANRTFRPVPKGRRDSVKRAAPKTDEQKESITKRLIKREEAKRAKLASLGIDYDFSGYAGKAIATPEPVKAAKAVKAKAVKAKKEKKVEEPPKKKSRKST